jgi:hypothetical protein
MMMSGTTVGAGAAGLAALRVAKRAMTRSVGCMCWWEKAVPRLFMPSVTLPNPEDKSAIKKAIPSASNVPQSYNYSQV